MDPIRILVVGSGSAGLRHLSILQKRSDVHVAVLPRRAERAVELRAAGLTAFSDASDAVAFSPDGVIVATDTGRHVADAGGWLERGVACLVEKPLARNAAEARTLIEAAGARAPLHVACCLRFNPGLVWIQQRLAEIGHVRFADIECLSWLPDWRPDRPVLSSYAAREGEGGVLLDLVHEIDYAAWLLGEQTSVSAALVNQGVLGISQSVEEMAMLLTRHPRGIVATTRLSYVTRPASRVLRIFGEQGNLEWDFLERHARHIDPSGATIASMTWKTASEMYDLQADAWLAVLRGEHRENESLATGKDGLNVLRVCDAARLSVNGWQALQ